MNDFSEDSVYLFQFGRQLMVKRLKFIPKIIKIISDNPTYENKKLLKAYFKNEDFEILSEVVLSGQRI
ncbi:hypothetical protein L4C54_23765 [Vibrio lamellibrachiae]